MTTCSYRCLHWKYFSEWSYYCHISSFFPPRKMASFHCHCCWLLYFGAFLWFLLMDDCNHLLGLMIILEINLLSYKIIAIYHVCFYPIKMASFHRHHCWLLYFEVFPWFLLTDECNHSFRSLLALEAIFLAIVLSPSIIIFFSEYNSVFSPSPFLIVIF